MLIHEIFELQAKIRPGSAALRFEDRMSYTYSELNGKANQLAYWLQKNDIKKGDTVALSLTRSEEQVIAFLACLKLGAVYLPIDPSVPPDFIATILDDTRPKCFITQNSLLQSNSFKKKLINITLPRIKIVLDVDKEAMEQESTKNLDTEIEAADPSFIVYSSGSTGKPKGMLHTSNGFDYWEKAIKESFDFCKGPDKAGRVAGLAGFGYDAWIWEVLVAWLYGATLYLVSDDTRTDIEKLFNFLKSHEINHILLPPSLLMAFAKLNKNLSLTDVLCELHTAGLQEIATTGERALPVMLKAALEASIRFFNLYGPSEAKFGLSIYQAKKEDLQGDAKKLQGDDSVPIGYPHSDKVKIYILNDKGEPIKKGEEGTLYIESPYLATYINRPEEEINNFVTFPANENKPVNRKGKPVETDRRLFKCDVVSLKENGKLYYCSRGGPKFKNRGQFVNLTGIETLLLDIPSVVNARVVVRKRPGSFSNKPYLVAFIVSKDPPQTRKKLYQFLQQKLPLASIPSHFEFINSLPLNMNQKVDDKALLEFSLKKPSVNGVFGIPRTKLEASLIEIWREILELEKEYLFPVDYSFASLGGDSIEIAALSTKLKKEFGVEIPTSKFSELSKLTIEKLAQLVYRKICEQRNDIVNLIEEGNSQGEINDKPLFLVAPITGEANSTYLPFATQLKNLGINRSIYGLNAPGLFDELSNCVSIKTMAEAYIFALKRKQPKGPYYLGGWSFGCTLLEEIVRQLEKQGEVAFAGLIDGFPHSVFNKIRDEAKQKQHYCDYLLDTMRMIMPAFKDIYDNLRDKLKVLPFDQQVLQLFKELTLNNNDVKRTLDVIKVQLLASVYYQPKKIEKTVFTVFTSSETRSKLRKFFDDEIDEKQLETFFWQEFCEQKIITNEPIAGNHFAISNNPGKWAAQLIQCLSQEAQSEEKKKAEFLSNFLDKIKDLDPDEAKRFMNATLLSHALAGSEPEIQGLISLVMNDDNNILNKQSVSSVETVNDISLGTGKTLKLSGGSLSNNNSQTELATGSSWMSYLSRSLGFIRSRWRGSNESPVQSAQLSNLSQQALNEVQIDDSNKDSSVLNLRIPNSSNIAVPSSHVGDDIAASSSSSVSFSFGDSELGSPSRSGVSSLAGSQLGSESGNECLSGSDLGSSIDSNDTSNPTSSPRRNKITFFNDASIVKPTESQNRKSLKSSAGKTYSTSAPELPGITESPETSKRSSYNATTCKP